MFASRFIREQVDPRVKAEWEAATGKRAPFGRLRLAFEAQHCRRINPYGDGFEHCPFRIEECAMAFLGAVQSSLVPGVHDPAAYFVKVARMTGIERADHKPLTRERHREKGPGHPGGPQGGDAAGRDRSLGSSGSPAADPDPEPSLYRARRRPVSIGDVLRTFDSGSRQGPAHDGEESPER